MIDRWIAEATYLERTKLHFEPTDYVSFGLSDKEGFLTNAGLERAIQRVGF